MKLRNKQTGKIPDKIETIAYIQWSKKIMMVYINNDGERIVKQYDSLETFNSEWEDVPEEPKGTYFINTQGDVQFWDSSSFAYPDDWTKEKQIGNYFSSREEAELAVRKLKAWKRLKDKGVRFGMRRHSHYGGEMFWQCPNGTGISDKQIWKDLDLLFCTGGEE